jgi:hypothetical protein
MVRLILVAIVLLVLFAGGLAVGLFHFFGWKGLVAFPLVAIGLVWLGKIILGKLLSVAASKLISIKSEVLRGATMTVRSVTPVPEPPDIELEELDEEEEEMVESNGHGDRKTEFQDDDEDEDADDEDEEDEPMEYFEVDLTITPRATGTDRLWEPGELLLTSGPASRVADLENTEVGAVYDVEVFDGSDFDVDDECKYAGEQRLRVIFAVKPGTSKAWLQYYNEPLGSLELPPWKV